jgi:hypothetical protein
MVEQLANVHRRRLYHHRILGYNGRHRLPADLAPQEITRPCFSLAA